jgi:hypothetical protein
LRKGRSDGRNGRKSSGREEIGQRIGRNYKIYERNRDLRNEKSKEENSNLILE